MFVVQVILIFAHLKIQFIEGKLTSYESSFSIPVTPTFLHLRKKSNNTKELELDYQNSNYKPINLIGESMNNEPEFLEIKNNSDDNVNSTMDDISIRNGVKLEANFWNENSLMRPIAKNYSEIFLTAKDTDLANAKSLTDEYTLNEIVILIILSLFILIIISLVGFSVHSQFSRVSLPINRNHTKGNKKLRYSEVAREEPLNTKVRCSSWKNTILSKIIPSSCQTETSKNSMLFKHKSKVKIPDTPSTCTLSSRSNHSSRAESCNEQSNELADENISQGSISQGTIPHMQVYKEPDENFSDQLKICPKCNNYKDPKVIVKRINEMEQRGGRIHIPIKFPVTLGSTKIKSVKSPKIRSRLTTVSSSEGDHNAPSSSGIRSNSSSIRTSYTREKDGSRIHQAIAGPSTSECDSNNGCFVVEIITEGQNQHPENDEFCEYDGESSGYGSKKDSVIDPSTSNVESKTISSSIVSTIKSDNSSNQCTVRSETKSDYSTFDKMNSESQNNHDNKSVGSKGNTSEYTYNKEAICEASTVAFENDIYEISDGISVCDQNTPYAESTTKTRSSFCNNEANITDEDICDQNNQQDDLNDDKNISDLKRKSNTSTSSHLEVSAKEQCSVSNRNQIKFQSSDNISSSEQDTIKCSGTSNADDTNQCNHKYLQEIQSNENSSACLNMPYKAPVKLKVLSTDPNYDPSTLIVKRHIENLLHHDPKTDVDRSNERKFRAGQVIYADICFVKKDPTNGCNSHSNSLFNCSTPQTSSPSAIVMKYGNTKSEYKSNLENESFHDDTESNDVGDCLQQFIKPVEDEDSYENDDQYRACGTKVCSDGSSRGSNIFKESISEVIYDDDTASKSCRTVDSKGRLLQSLNQRLKGTYLYNNKDLSTKRTCTSATATSQCSTVFEYNTDNDGDVYDPVDEKYETENGSTRPPTRRFHPRIRSVMSKRKKSHSFCSDQFYSEPSNQQAHAEWCKSCLKYIPDDVSKTIRSQRPTSTNSKQIKQGTIHLNDMIKLFPNLYPQLSSQIKEVLSKSLDDLTVYYGNICENIERCQETKWSELSSSFEKINRIK